MDRINNEEFKDVLETVFLFLKNNKFNESAETFRKECHIRNIILNNISGKVLYKCSRREANKENVSLTDKRIMFYTFLKNDEEKDEMPNSNHLSHQFKLLKDDYKSLLDVTLELTKLLQLNLEEQAKNVHSVLSQCEFLHPSLFQPIKKQNVSEQTTRHLDSSQGIIIKDLEQTYTEKEEKLSDDITSASLSTPLVRSEVKNILDNIINNVLKLENVQSENSYDNNQEIRKILEDIIQEVMISPREQPVLNESQLSDTSTLRQEKCFQVLPNNAGTPVNLRNDKTDFNDVDSLSHVNTITQNSSLDAKQPMKRKEEPKMQSLKGHKLIERFPKTPLCYLEACRKTQSDCTLPCKCMKCLPEQSRYYCSCFDLICKDLDEDHINANSSKKSQFRKKMKTNFNEKQKSRRYL